jgi:hypothetical protein
MSTVPRESQVNIFGDREAPAAWVRLVELFRPKRVKLTPAPAPLPDQQPLPGFDAHQEPGLETSGST